MLIVRGQQVRSQRLKEAQRGSVEIVSLIEAYASTVSTHQLSRGERPMLTIRVAPVRYLRTVIVTDGIPTISWGCLPSQHPARESNPVQRFRRPMCCPSHPQGRSSAYSDAFPIERFAFDSE